MYKKLSLMILVAGLLVATTATSAEAGVDIERNGVFSRNRVAVRKAHFEARTQKNFAYFENDVKVKNNTGGNSSSFNTDGKSNVKTGGASTLVGVENTANSNKMEDGCGCPDGDDHDVSIKRNGAKSSNSVKISKMTQVKKSQKNAADIDNDVYVGSNTGGNSTSYNTGGNSSVQSGSTSTTVHVSNTANMNVMGD